MLGITIIILLVIAVTIIFGQIRKINNRLDLISKGEKAEKPEGKEQAEADKSI